MKQSTFLNTFKVLYQWKWL